LEHEARIDASVNPGKRLLVNGLASAGGLTELCQPTRPSSASVLAWRHLLGLARSEQFPKPFGLSLSKPSPSLDRAGEPFDKLRANGNSGPGKA
jgi:hypothetical protein